MSQRLLILGGTQFVGRHLSEHLLQQAELEVTLFHRGLTHPELFPEFRHVFGDRETDAIRQVSRQDWDLVMDFSAYYPQTLAQLADTLLGRVGRYVMVSSISAHDLSAEPAAGERLNETSPTLDCSAAEAVNTDMLTYGKRKAACERMLLQRPGLQPVIFRPGLIYGPYDPTDRAYYWLWRMQTQARLLVAEPQIRQHWSYAPDLARILVQALLGPQPPRPLYLALTHEPLRFGEILDALAAACGRHPERIPVSAQWLEQQGLQYWQDLPLSLPFERLFERSALLADFQLELTAYADSWAASRDYYSQLGWPTPQTGISLEREQTLLRLAR